MTEALFTAIQAYAQSAPAGSEEQADAQALLTQFASDGTMDEGMAALQDLGNQAGVDPFAEARAQQAQGPQQTPMAQGISAGLMGQANG